MSFQRPIFNKGLFGRANASVCNAWMDSAETVAQNAEGIAWASDQLVRGRIVESWLAKLISATLIAPNRWKYQFEPFAINLIANNAVPTNLQTGTFGANFDTNHESLAFNIRELRNTATVIDGSPLPAGTTIGPVGSDFNGSTWSVAGLAGYVLMNLEYDSRGYSLFWFDTPNPTACPPEQGL